MVKIGLLKDFMGQKLWLKPYVYPATTCIHGNISQDKPNPVKDLK